MRRLVITLTFFFALTGSAHAAWTWPVSGEVITHYRNGTDPYATGQHRGIDIAAPVGSAVRAAAAGDVRFAGTAGSSGLTISIRTGDGYDTSYLHLSSLAVRAGARVAAGDRIGAVGTTGTRSATEPHLHFGVRTAGTRHAYHDPLAFLPPAPPGDPAAPPTAPAPEPIPAPPASPAPAPAPIRAAPGPAPAPLRAPGRAPHPGTTPNAAPAPLPSRKGVSRPVRTPIGTPSLVRARPEALPAHRPAWDRVNRTARTPAADTASRRAPAVSGAPRRAEAQPNAPKPASSPGPDGPTHAGPDIGWALTCAGLLLAAGILGLTGDGTGGTRRARRRLAGAFRHTA